MKIKLMALALAAALLTGSAFAADGGAAGYCTRSEFFELLATECKVKPLLYEGAFADLTAADPAADTVQGLLNADIIDLEMAPDGQIKLNSFITNEEAVSLMVRGLRAKKNSLTVGADVHFADRDEIAPWALSYVEVAVANGLIQDGGMFYPKNTFDEGAARDMMTNMEQTYRSLPLAANSGLQRIEFPVLDIPAGVTRPSILNDEYQLVFDDEFEGDSLNTKNWGYNYSWGHSHNHSGWCVPENVIVKDGILTLRGDNVQHPDSVGKQYTFSGQKADIMYTSGAVNTAGTFRFNYGYFEARLKMPTGKGMWPAWWMLKDGWPPEIDMLEILCSRPQQLRVNCHYGPAWDSERSHEQVINLDFNSSDDFHVYGFEWTPKYMKYYVDGVQVGHALTTKEALDQCTNMYMILNLAIDGWDGKPDATTVWPAEFQCDWVRVWQKNEY